MGCSAGEGPQGAPKLPRGTAQGCCFAGGTLGQGEVRTHPSDVAKGGKYKLKDGGRGILVSWPWHGFVLPHVHLGIESLQVWAPGSTFPSPSSPSPSLSLSHLTSSPSPSPSPSPSTSISRHQRGETGILLPGRNEVCKSCAVQTLIKTSPWRSPPFAEHGC